MNHLKSLLGALLFVCTSLVVQAQTETQTEYYRYFTIEVQSLGQSEFNQFAAARNANTYLNFEKYCGKTSSILVRVSASEPKRIEAMKSDIISELQAEFPAKTVKTVSIISYSDQLNFCK